MPADTGKLSQDTLDHLSDAKKGKIRRFVMIAKGTNIVSLLVYKKGSLEKLKKEAKEAGKGQFYFGTVDGSGQALSFKLSTVDGFTDAPVKNTILKSFLSEGGYNCKPEFQIVTALPEVADDEAQPNEAQGNAASTTTVDASTTTTPSPSAAPIDLTQWRAQRLRVIQSLKELAKAIAEAKDPDSAAAIIELKAVIANLTESPTDPQQVVELRRYLLDDDVVADVCDYAFDFRNDLLNALPTSPSQI